MDSISFARPDEKTATREQASSTGLSLKSARAITEYRRAFGEHVREAREAELGDMPGQSGVWGTWHVWPLLADRILPVISNTLILFWVELIATGRYKHDMIAAGQGGRRTVI